MKRVASATETGQVHSPAFSSDRAGASEIDDYAWYRSPARYLKPVSTATVATVLPRPSSCASCSAAVTLRPEDVPANIPSSFARRRAISRAGGFLDRAHFVAFAGLQVRRTESGGDPLDAVRSSFPGGEHRRGCWLERHNA